MRPVDAIAAVEQSIEEDPNESINFKIKNLAERFWFAGLQNPTRAKVEAERSSMKKVCLAMKLTFGLRCPCILKKSLVDVIYGRRESFIHILTMSLENAIEP